MPNSVVVGPSAQDRTGHITLGGDLHIVVPPEVIVPEAPLESSVTVVVRERRDGVLVAERITERRGEGLFSEPMPPPPRTSPPARG